MATFFWDYVIVSVILIFIKNWLNDYYEITQSPCFFLEAKDHMNEFWFMDNYEK